MLMINQVYPLNKQVSLDGLYLGQNLAGIAAEIGRRVVLADFLVDQNEVVAKANPKGRFEIPAELKNSSDWVFAPETEYEQRGLVPDVVYTCGALERDGEIWMYYGGADTVVGLAIAKTSDLVDFVLKHDFLHEQITTDKSIH